MQVLHSERCGGGFVAESGNRQPVKDTDTDGVSRSGKGWGLEGRISSWTHTWDPAQRVPVGVRPAGQFLKKKYERLGQILPFLWLRRERCHPGIFSVTGNTWDWAKLTTAESLEKRPGKARWLGCRGWPLLFSSFGLLEDFCGAQGSRILLMLASGQAVSRGCDPRGLWPSLLPGKQRMAHRMELPLVQMGR